MACALRRGICKIEVVRVRDPAAVDRELLAKNLRGKDLVLSFIGTGPMQREDKLFLMDEDNEKRAQAVKRLYALIDLGAAFKVPVVIAKYRGTTKDVDGCRMEDLAKILQDATQVAESKGIEISIEPQNATNINNLNSIGETVDWLEKIISTKFACLWIFTT